MVNIYIFLNNYKRCMNHFVDLNNFVNIFKLKVNIV